MASIFILDDHPALRYGIKHLVGARADLEISGEAGSIAEARERIRRECPAVLVADIWLPDGSGLDFIREIRQSCPRTQCLVYSIHDEKVFAIRAVQSGAAGFVMKRAPLSQVTEAIDAVLAGEIYLSPGIAPIVLRQLLKQGESSGSPTQDPMANLSPRELEVFRLLGHGATARAIARMLKLSLKTVESHKTNLRDKLGVKTGHELSYLAFCYFHSL